MTRVLLVAVLLVAGCSGPAAAPRATDEGPRARMESVRTECMRGRGFQYVPTAPNPQSHTPEFRKRAAGDYAAMLAFRQRYGYMVFSALVYPVDPAAGGYKTGDDPNNRYVEKLSPRQGAAYLEADDACYRQAAQQVLHRRVKDMRDLMAQMNEELDREEARILDTDPRLVALARSYAACMRAKGYRIPSEKPREIGSTEVKRFWKLLNGLGRRGGVSYMPQLPPEEARPYLSKEIASALDDLACGKDFFHAYNPRYQAIWDEVSRRWGQG